MLHTKTEGNTSIKEGNNRKTEVLPKHMPTNIEKGYLITTAIYEEAVILISAVS